MTNPYAPAPPSQRPPDQQASSQPPSPPPRRGQAPPPDPAQQRLAMRWLGRFALLVFASLVAAGLPLPWQAGALAFSLPALVVGTLALRAVVRAGMRRLPVVMLGVGLTMTAFMVLGQIGLLVLWPVQSDLQDCRDRALTLAAAEVCQAEFDERVAELTRFPTQPG